VASVSLCAIACTNAVSGCADAACTAYDDHAGAADHPSSHGQPQKSSCSCICQAPAVPLSADPATPAAIADIYRMAEPRIAPIADLPPPDHIPLA
jgi:hypothetical protein